MSVFTLPLLLIKPLTSPIDTAIQPYLNFFHEYPLRALGFTTLALGILLVLAAFIFTGGALPSGLGFLLSLKPMMGLFITSAALWFVIAEFLALSVAALEVVYLFQVGVREIEIVLFSGAIRNKKPKQTPQHEPINKLDTPSASTARGQDSPLADPKQQQTRVGLSSPPSTDKTQESKEANVSVSVLGSGVCLIPRTQTYIP